MIDPSRIMKIFLNAAAAMHSIYNWVPAVQIIDESWAVLRPIP
jgi:hypothetical protein